MSKPVNEQTVLAILLRRIVEEREKERTNGVGTELQPTETLTPDNESFSRLEVYNSDKPNFEPGLFVKIKDGKITMTAFTVESVLDVCDEVDAAPEDTYLGGVKSRQIIQVERDKEALRGDRIANDANEQISAAEAFKLTAEGNKANAEASVLNDEPKWRRWKLFACCLYLLFVCVVDQLGSHELAKTLAGLGLGGGALMGLHDVLMSDKLVNIIKAFKGK